MKKENRKSRTFHHLIILLFEKISKKKKKEKSEKNLPDSPLPFLSLRLLTFDASLDLDLLPFLSVCITDFTLDTVSLLLEALEKNKREFKLHESTGGFREKEKRFYIASTFFKQI